MKSGVSMKTFNMMIRHTSKVQPISIAKAQAFDTVGIFMS